MGNFFSVTLRRKTSLIFSALSPGHQYPNDDDDDEYSNDVDNCPASDNIAPNEDSE